MFSLKHVCYGLSSVICISWCFVGYMYSFISIPERYAITFYPLFGNASNSSITSTIHPSCLVIIFGQTRAWQLTYNSFRDHLLDPYQCDLALSIGTKDENASNPFYRNAKYIWKHDFDTIGYEKGVELMYKELAAANNASLSYDEWVQIWKDFKFNHDNHRIFEFMAPLWPGNFTCDDDINEFECGSTGSSGIGVITRYFTVKNILKYDLINKYKIMVYTRSDFKYMCDHNKEPFADLANDSNVLWIPDGRGWGGIYDRHFVSSSSTFVTINSVLAEMMLNAQHMINVINKIGKRWQPNSEQLIQIWIDETNSTVKRYDPSMYLVRSNHTFTTWSRGTYYDKNDGSNIKYENEYANTLKFCDNKTWNYTSLYRELNPWFFPPFSDDPNKN